MKVNDKILDSSDHPKWSKYIKDDKEILWEGHPKIELNSKILTGHTYYDVMTGFTSPIVLYLFFAFSIAYLIYGPESFTAAIPLIVVLTVIPFIIDLLIGKQETKTTYAISKDYVLFRFQKLFRTKVYAINIDEIISVGSFGVGEHLKTIYFVTLHKVPFKTYNFETNRKRDYPTFERIENHEVLLQLLEEKVSQNNLPPRVYTDKMTSAIQLSFARRIVALILFVMVAFLVDYYALPSKTVTDTITHQKNNTTPNFDFGATYYTAKGYHFGAKHRYTFEGDERNITLTASPVFRSVKSIVNSRMDYSNRIDSTLKGFALYPYIVLIISLLISYKLLMTNSLKSEILFQIIAVNTFILILLYVAWTLN